MSEESKAYRREGAPSLDDNDGANADADREDLLAVLDRDIESTRRDKEAGGWTTWAMAGAAAAGSGLALSTWEIGGFSIRESAAFFILASLVIQIVSSMEHLARLHEPIGPARVRVRALVAGDRPRVLVTLLVAAVLSIVFYWAMTPVLWRPLVLLGTAYYALVAAFNLLVMARDFAEVPFLELGYSQKSAGRVVVRSNAVAMQILPFALLACILVHVQVVPSGTKVGAMKVGVLASITLYILARLGVQPGSGTFLRLLEDLRRRLILRTSSLQDVRRDYEATMLGLPASELMHDDIDRARDILDRSRAQVKSANDVLDILEQAIETLAATFDRSKAGLQARDADVVAEMQAQSVELLERADRALKALRPHTEELSAHKLRLERHTREVMRVARRAAWSGRPEIIHAVTAELHQPDELLSAFAPEMQSLVVASDRISETGRAARYRAGTTGTRTRHFSRSAG